ncbi:MAG TPA: hypothetical protein PKA10_08275 [Selenomonadales bacterium]|nr:hypothetical protein [Selenomonadales bacterium]
MAKGARPPAGTDKIGLLGFALEAISGHAYYIQTALSGNPIMLRREEAAKGIPCAWS